MRLLAIGTGALIATAASAQPIHINHHLTVEEVDAFTGAPVAEPNGIIEPGEGALIRLGVSFTPGVGSEVYGPSGQVGTVHAFAASQLHLASMPSPSAAGSWQSIELAPGFGEAYRSGNPMGDGRMIYGIGPYQEAVGANQGNPIEIVWQGIWVPEEYTERTVEFVTAAWGISAYTSALWVEWSGMPGEYAPATGLTVGGSLEVRVGPGPEPCYANCDNSTTEPVLTVDDFTCFINEFASAQGLPPAQQIEHYANCDGSTTEPVLTVDDFTCFINEFAQGCP